MNNQQPPVTIWSLADAEKYHVHSPGLAKWLINNLPYHQLVIDYGCGLGKYLAALSHCGFVAYGYEGTEGIGNISVYQYIENADISKPLPTQLMQHTSLCIEVMEHLLPEQEEIALANITTNCNLLILSWAIPGQPGHGHNNCRDYDYVVSKLTALGFTLDHEKTHGARNAAAGTDPYLQFFRNTIYVFEKN